MMIRPIIFGIVLAFFSGMLYYNLKRIFSYLQIAKNDNRTDNPGRRIIHTLKVAFGQTKIFRQRFAGIVHVGIYWGFLVLLFLASEAVFQGFYHKFNWSFLGPIYPVITISTDFFSLVVIIAVTFSFLRRFVFKVKRLQGDRHETLDAIIVFGSIFIIVSSLMIEKSSCYVLGTLPESSFCPVTLALTSIIPVSAANIIYEISWWVHILAILLFANYLPFSKHFHVYTSIPNVYFSPEKIPNKVDRIDFEQEGVEKFGVVDLDDLSWKSIFDSYSCTHCGRCTSVCPANLTGKELSPREIIVQIRERTKEAAPIMLKMKQAKDSGKEYIPSEEEQKILDKKFVGDYENIDALWQCTTCGACMQECPITIEHVPVIIGMRQSLVMMESNFPQEIQPSFSDLENNGSPWSFSPTERADWAEGTGIKTCAESGDFDILFWVGCAGSFDDRAKKISLAFSKIMQKANINFRILGQEERCNGDVARRAGNEYLADMLIKMNIETLNRYNVKKIVTICPHCFNTFKNEYPDFGGNYEVVHHSEFIMHLIEEGKIRIKPNLKNDLKLTYHDSCYLGRYNQIYDAPRFGLEKIVGKNLVEPKRAKDKGFCCGAGGAQMFLEETKGKRVNIERTEELLETGANCIAVNCPFCMTMITDGVKAKDKVDEIAVKDIAEIILDNLED
ncbi:4Fe-4S dicluster domain-containing protein [Bacteroidetes/Chlorobi group bacterium ChocPot_Mid]|nr:MAG: 4Fe-4S dicluster domain-containing protein [Bacteroidetes/Chlorobi group bacterium ChocPot_Mid]